MCILLNAAKPVASLHSKATPHLGQIEKKALLKQNLSNAFWGKLFFSL